MIAWLNRLRALARVKLFSSNSEIYFAKNVQFSLRKGAGIEVHGKVTIGFPLPGTGLGYPSHDRTIISLDKNARLVFLGNAFIANGCDIFVGENGTLIFGGNNFIAHNAIIFCKNRISFGKNSSASWHLTAIDDDGHYFFRANGTQMRRLIKPLIIGDHVAIQANVTIPHGVTVGDGSIIGAVTVLRQDVPANSLVYGKQELKIKSNITYGFQFKSSDIP